MTINASTLIKPNLIFTFAETRLFPNQVGRRRDLSRDEFNGILSFLTPYDLARTEGVCRSWKYLIGENEWKTQCQIQLKCNLLDPATFLPPNTSYKEGLKLILERVYSEQAFRYFLGAEIETQLSSTLQKFNKIDPFDYRSTIGENYFWFDSPPYFKISVSEDFPYELNKPDNPNDEEAPQLIKIKSSDEKKTKSVPRILKVPNTINNLGVLFKYLKKGCPTNYKYVFDSVEKQHGNKRIQPGRICMRETIIGRRLSFLQQQEAAKKAGMIISSLGHRILFNFLLHASTNTYADRQTPQTYARTSTLIEWENSLSPAGCCKGDSLGLGIMSSLYDDSIVGAAVCFPLEL